ncbi:MAG: serine/threonine-protein kinase [Myxococcales bacterium]
MGTSSHYVKLLNLRRAMHGHDPNDSFARHAALAGAFIGKRVGNYLITKLLGSGGMGDVYIAEHPALGKRVAVKFLSDQLGAQIAERFLAEARAVTLINHPGVVEILDFGELEGHLYYVMELLEGRELEAYARDHGKLSANEVLPLLSQIAAALEAVHALGVVHRDLKPTNIFVVEKGGPPTVKLLDFGIAKVFSPTHPAQTIAGQVLGTPAYMSPEQAAGQTDRIGPHTDIYSLGVVLYELLCGHLPFVHELPLQVMAMHLRDVPPPLASKDKTIAPLVCAVVEKCLRKNPEERPKSARLLLQAFEAAVERSAPRRSSTSMRAVVPARKTAPPDPSRQTGFQEHPAATQTIAPAWPPLRRSQRSGLQWRPHRLPFPCQWKRQQQWSSASRGRGLQLATPAPRHRSISNRSPSVRTKSSLSTRSCAASRGKAISLRSQGTSQR